MADDVPVCDVLLEAMEYLSKLGTNLRTRSETLKDKRIRRDKLKNAHAVQKAANKVLLICELSKKSLENVESGVKKVLQLVDKSQATIGVGGNSDKRSPGDKISKTDRLASSEKKDFQLFMYRSYKLKIAKKVPVKHYTSVKVMARHLPKSMQEKYPVYYDCKLYRLRKRRALKEKELPESSKITSKEDFDSGAVVKDIAEKSTNNLMEESDCDAVVKEIVEKSRINSKEESDCDAVVKDIAEKSTNNLMEESDCDAVVKEIVEKSRINSKEESDCDAVVKDIAEKSKNNLMEESDSDAVVKDIVEKSMNILKEEVAKNSGCLAEKIRKSSEKSYSEIPRHKKDDNSSIKNNLKPDSGYKKQSNKERKTSLSKKDESDAETKEGQKERQKPLLEDSESENELQGKEQSRSNEQSSEKRKADDKRKKLQTKNGESSSEGSKSDSEKLKKVPSRKDRKKTTIIDSDSDDDSKKNNEYNSEKSDKKTFCGREIKKDTSNKVDKNKTQKLSSNMRSNRILSTDSESSVKESNKELRETAKSNKISEDKLEKMDGNSEEDLQKSPEKEKSKEKERKTSGSSRCSGSTENKNRDSDSQGSTAIKTIEEKNTSNQDRYKEKELGKKVDFIDLYSDDENSGSKKADETEQQKENKGITKPLIKCVSLKNLLKPDILPTVMPVIDIKKQDKESIMKDSTKDRVKAKKTVQYQDEEEFWSKKKAEVMAFKPKEFTIKITRLPIINVDVFLQTHKIKIITQCGKVIHEIKSKNKAISPHQDNSQDKSKDNNSLEWSDISKSKTALLFDSDSDTKLNKKRKQSSDHEAELNKKECSKNNDVNDSENKTDDMQTYSNAEGCSESNCKNDVCDSPQTQLEIEDNSEDKDESNGNSPNKEITPPRGEDPETVKLALLNDSSNSTPTPSTPKHKRKKHSEGTPNSKRKHIMQSMHAKKMLLTYSSSSGNEDENFKNDFKQIKEALLKDGSSDDNYESKKELSQKKHSSDSESGIKKKRSREQLSSDSDENIVKKVKKRRKLRKTGRRRQSKSPSPAKEDENKVKSGEEAGDNESIDSTIDQVDGTMDEQSNSSNSKMGRTNEKASSSQNSDAPDDKAIDGLTNLSSLNKTRRRRDSDAEGSGSSKRKSKRLMPKATTLIKGEEGLLEAPMTDDESAADSDGDVEEDLPPVSLSGLNGGGIGELARDDLLGETDSSSSNEKDQQSEDNAKKEESSSEDQIKLKRRKIAISSDSEAGSSRRKRNKDADVRLSDFEDSETEEETLKKNKKKKKVDSDDGSAGSSDEGGKKKRKRIKQIDDSDASGSDSDNEGRNKHGRKNIRKVMGKNQLEEATKKAARQEKERIARIAERQKLYNNLEFDESGKPDEVVLDKVVLDFDPETKEPLIEVDRGLVKKLKPHQANGIKFMWDACFESVKRIKKDKGSGCILAHCMGLGKTLQVVSLTHTLLTHGELTKVERVLVVCPLSTVLNWVNEFKMWLKHAERDYEVDVYELSRYKQNSERAFQLSQWYNHGGVCVLGYEMFRNLSADNTKKYKKKMLKTFQEALVDPGPDMVVCDEGHLLKNEKTSLSQSMNRVRTLRRIVLTGTPLQNNLKEYYCMVQFVKPNLLGKYNEYLNRFVNPITNGQYTDSTEHDIRVMKRRSHVLHKMLDGAVQRRDYGVLAPFLPPKHEYVLFITLSEVQVKLYRHYLENYSRRPMPGKSSGFLFPDFQSLQRIWTHPLVLKYNSERYELMQQKKRDKEEEDSEGSLADFIDDDSSPEDTSTEESSDDMSDASDDSRKKSKKKKNAKKSKAKEAKEAAASRRRGTRANPVEMEVEDVKDLDQIEGRNDNPTEWWIPLVIDDELEDIRNSHKLQLLLEILRQCEAIGDKLLVFSQSLYSLDLIEHFLGKIDEATQDGRVDEKLGGHVGSWSPGVDYFRLDGSTSCENRSIWCKNFNREDNPRARLFLISTRAGGLGINLVAANRVVIFDVSWNPSHDVQSIFRVYRFGQKKPCYVYRFLAMGTMEEKIYERQVTKQAISKRVIDEQQIDRHYAENDLTELYKFEPEPPEPRPVPLVPKDRLFAEMLKQHEKCIYKFHEHDSLLENKEEETLTEEERKAAWEDFENEKNRPPPVPFANTWPPHNGMAGLLAQQQQQLAFAALASMLRKDMPGLTEEQIRGMLPLIYSSNPGLMQKLSDIYKYPQPSMMNPAAMMNSVMNPAAAAGGGASGLQYEPPWARDQQQQQQMRLNQLMQHQNMGAKYYAGGLGSRDPVAMALQQQRAREIMLERAGAGAGAAVGAGRPRGRPPLQPRAPPPGDVVNLDSD